MYKIKMFGLWIKERFGERLFVTALLWGLIGGAAFLLIDNDPTLEGLRFGWFYAWFRIPTYVCLLGLIVCIVGAIVLVIAEWVKSQYRDYQAFVMNGGKQKAKNDDEYEPYSKSE